MRQRTAFLVAILFSTSVHIHAFVAPSFAAKARYHAIPLAPMKMVRTGSFKQIQSSLVPPIPLQGESLRLADHFRLRFIAKEFILGFRYMFRVYPLLIAGSVLFHLLRTSVSVPQVDVTLRLSEGISVFHGLEGYAKLLCIRLANVSPEGASFGILLAPIFEELSYRGLAQATGRIVAASGLCWVAFIGRLSPILSIFSVGIEISFGLFALVLRMRHRTAVSKWASAIRDIAVLSLLLPTYILTIQLARKRKSKGVGDNPATLTQNQMSSTSESTQRSALDRRVARFISGKQTEVPAQLERRVYRSLNRASRFHGSVEFAYSHVPMSGPLLLEQQLLAIQKFCGTFISSLLVESRLAINRRNIWGSIGAHVAFNGLGATLLPQFLLVAAQVPATLSIRLAYIGLGLLLLQYSTYVACELLQRLLNFVDSR